MKILVTGATGFIGRHLVRRLLVDHSPADIVCLVEAPQTPRERQHVVDLQNTCACLIEGDLNNPKVSFEPPPRDIGVIYHLAGNTDTAATQAALRVNDIGCRNLLSWLAGSVDDARFMYASSIAALDRSGPADGPLNESSPCVPRTEYGRSKLRGEEVIRAEAPPAGCTYTILRLATVYGPGAKIDGLFDRLIKDSARHRLLARLNWPGRTSIVHVDDVTAIMVMLSKHADAVNETFCIANPEAPTIGTLAENIGHMVAPSVEPVRLPRWAWSVSRALAWSRSVQLLGAVVAHTAFWRLTLMVDDGFWFDTQKLQKIWTAPPKDLVEGLAEMLRCLP